MENKLKSVSRGVIEILQKAEVQTIMATGDNALTAISVARQCNIIDSEKPVYLGDVVDES